MPKGVRPPPHHHLLRSILLPYENIHGLVPELAAKQADIAMTTGPNSHFFKRIGDNPLDKWLMDDQSVRSQNLHLHCWSFLDSLLLAYSETGTERLLVEALRVAEEWSDLFASETTRDEAVGVRHMAWYDMAVGLRAYRLAYIMEVLEKADGDIVYDRELLERSLEMHVSYLADDRNIMFHNNHGLFQAAGQLATGRRLGHRSAALREAEHLGRRRLEEILDRQFSRDHAHLEHSPGYHRMVYSTLKGLIDAGLILDEDIKARAECIEEALSWFIMPNGHIANFGDTDHHQYGLSPDEAEKRWATEAMRFAVSRGKVGKRPLENIRLFQEGGYAAARVPHRNGKTPYDSYLLQQAAFHSRTHKHADTLSFIWYDRAHEILVDSGRFGYVGKTEPGSELHRDGFWYSDPSRVYCETSRAHNCLVFDGKNYPRKGTAPPGSLVGRSAVSPDGRVLAFESSAQHFEGLDHTRLIFMRAGQWLICLDCFDDRSCERRAAQWFHLDPKITAEKCGEAEFRALHPKTSVPLRIMALHGNIESVDHVRGAKEPEMQGWVSRRRNTLKPNDAIAFNLTPGKHGLLATLFSFSHEVSKDDDSSVIDDANANGGTLVWSDDKAEHKLTFARSAGNEFKIKYSTDRKRRVRLDGELNPQDSGL